MNLMTLCHGFRVGYVMKLGFGWFGTILLRLLPNCMKMMGLMCWVCCYYANLGLGAYIASKLCL